MWVDLKRKIGQLIVAGFEGTTVTEEIRDLITKYHVGNIILFERNCKNPKQVFELTKKLQKIAIESNGVPLFISIDQENGMVARMYSGVTHFPGNMAQGAADNLDYSYKIGRYTGEGLNALGINFNLAPSLDVNNNPKNPVIGVRSFGDIPEKVADLGCETIKGMQDAGIIATAKHFPGHGDTEVDSHLGLPIVNHGKERLSSVELYPFKKAVEAGVKAIMTAHIVFPAYEKENIPATLSGNILKGLLRDELKFDGLIITDCMEMKAIDDNFTSEEAAPMAVKAGADLICISHTFEKQAGSIKRIYEKVNAGEIPMEVIDDRVNRILKEKSNLNYKNFIEKEYEDIKNQMDKEEHLLLAKEASEKSITLMKNDKVIPLNGKNILVISPKVKVITGVEGKREDLNFGKILRESLPQLDICNYEIPMEPSDEVIDGLSEKCGGYDTVILCTVNGSIFKKQLNLAKKLRGKERNIILIVMRNPYDFTELSWVDGCLMSYEYTKNSVNSLIKVLKGEIKAEGRLPVNLQ